MMKEVKNILQTYSTIVVIDSLLKNEEIDSTLDRIQRNIKNNGGEIIEIDRWGKKRLAFEIKKRQYGFYIDIIFQAPGNVVKVMERDYGLDENILRYLTIAFNKKALAYREKQKEMSSKKEAESATKKAEVISEVIENPGVIKN